MNIFVLSMDIEQCARYHNDKHVNKMILESAQMLSTAVRLSGVDCPTAYKTTHKNHGSNVWARESLSNWRWLRTLALTLSDEFDWRFDRAEPHKSKGIILSLPEPDIEDKGLTPFYQGMPDEYRGPNAVDAYRLYYNLDKRIWFSKKTKEDGTKIALAHAHTWTKRGEPDWWWCEEKVTLWRVIENIEQERK